MEFSRKNKYIFKLMKYTYHLQPYQVVDYMIFKSQ